MFPWNSDIYLGTITFSKNAEEERVIVRVLKLLKRTEGKTAGVCLYFFLVRLIVYFPLLVILFYFNSFDPYSFEWRILAWNWRNLLICISLDSCPFVFLIIRGITVFIYSLLISYLFYLSQEESLGLVSQISFSNDLSAAYCSPTTFLLCMEKMFIFVVPGDEKGLSIYF